MIARDWAEARSVLAVRLDALGDVLMTGPALRALKQSCPGRQLTLLTSPAGAAVASLLPEIDQALVFEAPWMRATSTGQHAATLGLVERLREDRFDAAVIFTVYSQSPLPAALVCYLAGIPRRLAHCRENPYQLLTDWIPETEPDKQVRHEVRRQLDLVAAVGCWTADERMRLRVPDENRGAMRERLRQAGIAPERPWALLHPGASAPSRRYPPESFAAAAGRLVHEAGVQVLVVGGVAERESVAAIRAQMRAPSATIDGPMSIAELAALIEIAPVLIANNSGPAHIAAAVGTPVVDLYALTNPQHKPWMAPCRVLYRDVPCRNCYKSSCPLGHHDCLRLVPPDAVYQAALELLDAQGMLSAVPVAR